MHPEITERLASMSQHGDIPHLLFHGPRGSGKMTLVNDLLVRLYGPGVKRVTTEKRCVNTRSSKQTIEIDVRVSNYHIEIEPSDAGLNDKYDVQDVIKNMATNGSIAAALMSGAVSHKTIVLRGAGNSTKQAQAGLRRTMETFSGSCRLILVCTYASRVIEPLRSRCVSVRVPLPTAEALAGAVALKICSMSSDQSLVDKIVQNSGRSISQAMLMAKLGSCDKMIWVQYTEAIARGVFLEQSRRKLIDVRESLEELLTAGVPASTILKTLAHNLEGATEVKRDVVKWAAIYEHRAAVGSKDILHLEAFVATVMHEYKHMVKEFV
ncbi:unnamed protein product [Hapterophycus canaliculatus]